MGKKRIIKEVEGYTESVQQFFDDFIEQAEARLSPKSVRAYKQAYHRLIEWNGGEELEMDELDEKLFSYGERNTICIKRVYKEV